MRKDSEIFLRKAVEYCKKNEQNRFVINSKYFAEILNIKTALADILKELIECDCLTEQSRIINLKGDIFIELTYKGIIYFEKSKDFASLYTFEVSGGQINVAFDKGRIKGIQKSWIPYRTFFLILFVLCGIFLCMFKEVVDDKDGINYLHQQLVLFKKENQNKNSDGKLKIIFWDGKFAYQHWDGGYYINGSDVVEKSEINYLNEKITPIVYITIQDENGNVVCDTSSEHMESCLIDLCYGRYILSASADNYEKYVIELLLTPENKKSGVWQHNIYFIPESVRAKDIKVQVVDNYSNSYGNYEASIGFQGYSLSQPLDNQGYFEMSFILSKGEYIVSIEELDLHGRFVINDSNFP